MGAPSALRRAVSGSFVLVLRNIAGPWITSKSPELNLLRLNTFGRLYVTRDGRRLSGAAAQPRRLALARSARGGGRAGRRSRRANGRDALVGDG